MAAIAFGSNIIVAFRYRMKSTDRQTWLKSKKTFTTFQGAYLAAKDAARKHSLYIQHQVVFDVLGEVEELN